MSLKDWAAFFGDAGISSSDAHTYSAAFVQHNISSDMLEDLDKGDLQDMGITLIGDIKRILKYAKTGHLGKNKIIGGGGDKNDNKDMKIDKMIYLHDDNDKGMTRVEKDIFQWRGKVERSQDLPKVEAVFSIKTSDTTIPSVADSGLLGPKNYICNPCGKYYDNSHIWHYHNHMHKKHGIPNPFASKISKRAREAMVRESHRRRSQPSLKGAMACGSW